ncbi:MAG: L,D-transpeptidase [Bacteroidales bacterium]|nr:L,D-transpeptidase [Bacteroidales bacterium]
MSRKRRISIRRVFIAFGAFCALIALVMGIILATSAKPPVYAITACQTEISRAREVEADRYASHALVSAEYSCQLAINEWKYQNSRVFFIRDYDQMLGFANDAKGKAREAAELALHTKDSLQSGLSTKLMAVDHKIDHYDNYYAHLPLSGTTRRNFTSAKLRYMESKEAYERGDYKQVEVNLDVASQLITKSVAEAHSFLSDYFVSLSKWQRWSDETIKWSKNNGAYAIVVDKFAHKLYLYKDGKVKKEFNAELGPNWIGTKQYMGDKATPEGKYHITKKKSRPQTKYHKALLINYPNDDDKARYNANVKSGKIPKRGIGNLIEIHGDGGKGRNWTAGCVALTDNDIDKLYELVGVGTPVTIVGSLKSLQEINGF